MSSSSSLLQTDADDLIDLPPGNFLKALILKSLVIRGSMRPTYAIANFIRQEGYRIETRTVRRALDALEASSAVERVGDIGTRPNGNIYWRRRYWRPRLIRGGKIAHGD